jgi:hypothetical protein
MDTREALSILGISPGASAGEVRAAYLRLIRDRHPDVAGGDPGTARQAARVNQAYTVIRAVLADSGGAEVPASAPSPPTAPGSGDDTTPGARPRPWPFGASSEPIEAETVDGDTIAIAAPAGEAFAALFEAAGRVGHVAYFDRQLGILETVVRFEGGPTCSVLITLQGRAHLTEAFCTMESIEAAPTPPIRPVVEALVEELTRPGGDD